MCIDIENLILTSWHLFFAVSSRQVWSVIVSAPSHTEVDFFNILFLCVLHTTG